MESYDEAAAWTRSWTKVWAEGLTTESLNAIDDAPYDEPMTKLVERICGHVPDAMLKGEAKYGGHHKRWASEAVQAELNCREFRRLFDWDTLVSIGRSWLRRTGGRLLSDNVYSDLAVKLGGMAEMEPQEAVNHLHDAYEEIAGETKFCIEEVASVNATDFLEAFNGAVYEAANEEKPQDNSALGDTLSSLKESPPTPSSWTQHQLRELGVFEVTGQLGWLQCDACAVQWSPNIKPGGGHQQGWWKCPNGCNH